MSEWHSVVGSSCDFSASGLYSLSLKSNSSSTCLLLLSPAEELISAEIQKCMQICHAI